MINYFNNKTVFITGATSGLGLEMANQLADSGAHLALFGRKQLDEVTAQIKQRASANRVMSAYMETTDLDSVKTAMQQAKDELGVPDIVIHSAGVGKMLTFNDLSQEDFEWVNRVNIFGTRNVADVSFEYLKASQGQLMILASMAGITPNYGYAAYASSKFATLAIAEVLRYEWKPHGISITAACPPGIPTPLVEQEMSESPKISQVLKSFAGELKIEPACRYMLKGLAKKKFKVIPGVQAKLLAFNQAYFTKINRWVGDRVIAFMFKRGM